MPYIDREHRARLDPHIDAVAAEITDAGDLNYAITRLVLSHLGDSPRYADFNAAVGVLECAKLELYRTHVAQYEDRKRVANGDVRPAVVFDAPAKMTEAEAEEFRRWFKRYGRA